MSDPASASGAAAVAGTYVPILSALVTAIVSAVVAWLTARRTVQLEGEKVRLGVQQKVLEQLVSARLSCYPELFSLLSAMWKSPPPFEDAHQKLQTFLTDLNAWDSKHSILLGPRTINLCFEFRQEVRGALAATLEATFSPEIYRNLSDKVFEAGQQLELALRSDIGIYGFELAEARDVRTRPQTEY